MMATVLVMLALGAPPEERAVPTFATQAEVILVDVVVLDGDGKPVRGLTKDDFTVLEDGRPQSVLGFEARDMVAPGAAPAPGVSPGPVAPGTAPGPAGGGAPSRWSWTTSASSRCAWRRSRKP